MPQLNAYLSFDGNCADAMHFYARVLGAKVQALITFGQNPTEGQTVPAEHAGKIMHAYLVHPDFALMAGDMPPGMAYQGVKGVMMTLTYEKVEDAQRVFDAFADSGTVQMPMGPTFWVERFGMVVDRFGVGWGINGGKAKM